VSDGKLNTTTLSKTIVTTTSSVSKAGGTSAAKTEHKPGTTFAIKCTNQIIIAPKTDSETTSTTTSDGKKMPLASVSTSALGVLAVLTPGLVLTSDF
jgi:hypothetical protein